MHPYNCSIHPTHSYQLLENNCKKIEFAVWGGNQPDRKAVLCCTGYCFQYKIRIYCCQTQRFQQGTAISILHLLIPSALPAPRAAQLCLWLSQSCLIWNFSSSHRNSGDPPQLQLEGAGQEHTVCDLFREGDRQTKWLYLSVKRSENTKVAISGCPWLEI